MSLLNGYAFSFFRGFSLAMIITTCYALLSLLMFFMKPERVRTPHFLLFVLFSACLSFVSFFTVQDVDYSGALYIFLKLLIWATFITFCGRYFFDLQLLAKYMKGVIIITFIYLLVQYFFHYALHISIPCSFDLGIIKANSDAYEIILDATDSVFRPGSFWLEPGYLGYFYNSFLCICLFCDEYSIRIFSTKGRRLLYTSVTCLGIILSMSTGAIGSMLILFIAKLAIKGGKLSLRTLIVIAITILFGFFAIKGGWLGHLKGISESLDNSIWKLENLDKVGRVGESFGLLEMLPDVNKVIGVGLGNEKHIIGGEYMNGIVTVVYWSGYLGLGIWLLLYARLSKKFCRSRLQKISLFIIVFDGVFASLYFGAHSFIYFMIALYAPTALLRASKRKEIEEVV